MRVSHVGVGVGIGIATCWCSAPFGEGFSALIICYPTLAVCQRHQWALKQYGTFDLAIAKKWCDEHPKYDCSKKDQKIPDLSAPADGSDRMEEWTSVGGG